MSNIIIALAGNPNTGKSTIFNALTGSRQRVGNWPGKTVERKSGFFKHNDTEFEIVDLPGTYSLSAYSPEEQIARDFIIKAKPAFVLNVVDASNLERNLYLTIQIFETGTLVMIALNMSDQAEARGYQINTTRLSKQLHGAPVVRTTANQKKGIDELKMAIVSFSNQQENR
jgi:ferrous iron transport protein B